MASAETSATSRSRAPLLWILLPLLLGYILADHFPNVHALPLAIIGLAAALIASLKAFPSRTWVTLFLIGATLLSWGWRQSRLPPPLPEWEGLPAREATVTLEVVRLFHQKDAYGRCSGLGRITATPKHLLGNLTGQLTYFSLKPTDNAPAPLVRSQIIKAHGVLEPLMKKPSQRGFDRFLYRNDVRFRLTRGSIRALVEYARPFPDFCAAQQQRLQATLRQGAPEYATSLADTYIAMLLGEKAALSKKQKDAFAASGTLHFFAISGLHIGVIALTLSHLLRLVRIRGNLAALLGLAILFLYVQITGASPSATRAFWMTAFFWGSKTFGRQRSSLGALTASAIGVLILEPPQLWSIGFQLSYSVVAAILLYGLPLESWLREKWLPFRDLPQANLTQMQQLIRKAVQGLFLLFGVSLSATLISSPMSIAYFGTFSPGAVILNMLLVSVASLVIITGFLSLLMGLLGLSLLSGLLNHGAWVLITLMEIAVNRALEVPAMFFKSLTFAHDLVAPLCVLMMLAVLLIGAERYGRQRPQFYLLTPALLLATLLFLRQT